MVIVFAAWPVRPHQPGLIIERPLLGKIDIQFHDGTDWVSLLADATAATIRRGGRRDGLGVKTDVGLLTLTLKNVQDPLNGGALVPGQYVQAVTPEYVPIFSGRIAHFDSTYPLNKNTGQSRAVVTVTVADAVQIHGSTMRYGVDIRSLGDFETFEDRIGRLSGSANASIDVPVAGAPREVYAL